MKSVVFIRLISIILLGGIANGQKPLGLDPSDLAAAYDGALTITGFDGTPIADTPVDSTDVPNSQGFFAGWSPPSPPLIHGSIWVFVPNLEDQFPDLGITSGCFFSGPFVEGLLYGALVHELLHECLRDGSTTIDACAHIAINYTTYQLMCQEAGYCKELCAQLMG